MTSPLDLGAAAAQGSLPGRADSPLQRLDARSKILAFTAFIVLVVTTPARAVWAFGLYAVILLFLLGLSRISPGYVLKRALVIAPLVVTVAIFLPFLGHQAPGYGGGRAGVTQEGLVILWNVGAKAALSVLAVILLGSTTGFAAILAGLGRLRAPRLLVAVISFMYRYTFILTDEALRMERALASRDYRRRWLWHAPVLGRMLGSLFVRGYERGERIYLAMVSRGYEGKMPTYDAGRFGLPETAFLGSLLAVALAIRVSAWVWW